MILGRLNKNLRKIEKASKAAGLKKKTYKGPHKAGQWSYLNDNVLVYIDSYANKIEFHTKRAEKGKNYWYPACFYYYKEDRYEVSEQENWDKIKEVLVVA